MAVPPRETIKPFYESNHQLLRNFAEDLTGMQSESYYQDLPQKFKDEVDYQLTLIETQRDSILKQIAILEELG